MPDVYIYVHNQWETHGCLGAKAFPTFLFFIFLYFFVFIPLQIASASYHHLWIVMIVII